jgi:phasin family protein
MNDVANFAEFQKLGQKSFDTAVHSYGEWSKALQALATRITENTKKAFEDTTRTWEQLISAKSVEQAIEIQSQYAKRAYDNFVAEASKLGEWYVGLVQDASKPVEQAVKNSVEQSIKRKVV